ncbi:GntR family transcriptional regulator [Phycisphaera mikurensis]|uniref:Putative GntR family transcriptional regulator n=1 Tax=Phycisphaera mikurensis (strain NBRC 102666 / KCTC 22515 / FYK2301M01) TaxID=1142394 RepID=I0IDW7_PHYMF|nr:GntR family transcriptional regulator [Phycisphaera mikurensis]MBB6441262.1 LacI family transcriptional regulator [Phycisphaera mikurensis]BAM03455.1 putative GntR family transcriptional regulator [Phycisphaera mikurensis NBRC 102666]
MIGRPATPPERPRDAAAGPLRPVRPRAGALLYVTVRDALHDAIRDGRFAPGERLPSTKDLAAMFEVSLVTTHRAMQSLEARGVLDRVQGRGTFVTERSERRVRRLAVVLQPQASLADYYYGDLLDGMNRAARELGADLLIRHATEPVRRVVPASNGSSPERVWGGCDAHLLVNPLPEAAEAFAVTLEDGVPSVLVGARHGDMPHVDVDNADLIEQAVTHLHDRGHRRILFVGGAGNLSNSRDRLDAFATTCEAFKVAAAPRLVASSWRLHDGEKRELGDLLGSSGGPTAVVAAGYYLALDVYDVAGRRGLEIPKHLSVVGVGDPMSAPHLSPPLTTMRQPLVELGHAAVEAAIHLIEGEPQPSINLRARLVPRASCRAI